MNRSFVPRYYAIEQALRERIARSQPSDPLPSESELCEEFRVSRMTARHAVQRLAQEGLVFRVPGRGTFVAHPQMHRQATRLLSFTEEMRQRGLVPSSRVVEQRERAATPEDGAALQLGEGASVIVIGRVRLADGLPMAYEQAVFPASCAGVLTAELEQGSLHRTLIELGHQLSRGQATLTAETASKRDAELLDVRLRAPLLVERRLIFDERDAPLEYTQSRYVAERYKLGVQFEVESAQVLIQDTPSE